MSRLLDINLEISTSIKTLRMLQGLLPGKCAVSVVISQPIRGSSWGPVIYSIMPVSLWMLKLTCAVIVLAPWNTLLVKFSLREKSRGGSRDDARDLFRL